MNIALIARGCQPGSGIELYTYELAKRLIKNHQVTILTNPDHYTDCGATLLPIRVPARPKWLSILNFSQQAGQQAKQGQFDIVHTQGSDGNWGDVVTAHSSHGAGMRASLKINTGLTNCLRKRLSITHKSVLLREQQALSSARKIIVVSRRVARQLKAYYPRLKKTMMEIIYPGCELQSHDQQWISEQRAHVRASHGLAADTILFVLVANDPLLKGAKRVIQALTDCREKNCGLLIVSPNKNQHNLRKLANRYGVLKQVYFTQMAGDATAAYSAADVYIGLPEYESFGITYLEAMSLSKPVITFNNTGVAELLKNKGRELLLPYLADTHQVSRIMDKLIKDRSLRARLGRQAKAIADDYHWDGMAEKIEKVYEKVFQQKNDCPYK